MKYALVGCGRVAPSHINAAAKNGFEILAVFNPTLEFKYGASWGSLKISWFVTQMAFKENKTSSVNPGVGLISTADFEDEDEDNPVVADNVIEEELEEDTY